MAMAGSQLPIMAGSQPPIIDFTKDAMNPGTKTWDLTSKHVMKALEEHGFFMVTFDEINDEHHAAMFSSLEKLFDLPKDTKHQFTHEIGIYGYCPETPVTPLREVMGLPDSSPETIEEFTHLMWPQGNATFCETMNSYVAKISKIDETVRKMIFQSYGLERHFEKESKAMKYPLALMKHGAPMTNNDTRGMTMHFDKAFMTVYKADRVGLQVQTKDGEWITPDLSSPSSYVVIMGESAFGWSNGRIKAALHRVRLSGDKSRYTLGFASRFEGTTEVPSELVDEKHPLLYKPFDLKTLMKLGRQQAIDKIYTEEDENRIPLIAIYLAV